MAEEEHEESKFNCADVSRIIKESIENTIGGSAYDHDKANIWTGLLADNCTDLLADEQKPYKYVVTVMIIQKNRDEWQTGSACIWNNDTDGCSTIRWENRTMYCIVTVFGLAK